MYSIGQKVVCTDDSFTDFIKAIYTALPIKDQTYTVRDVLPGINQDNKTHEVAVLLEELTNPLNSAKVLLEELTNPLNSAKVPQERAFNIERFAPLDPNFEVEVAYDEAPMEHHGQEVGV